MRWFQFHSRIVRIHFASVMYLNNYQMIVETRSYIFRSRSRCRRRNLCLRYLARGARRMEEWTRRNVHATYFGFVLSGIPLCVVPFHRILLRNSFLFSQQLWDKNKKGQIGRRETTLHKTTTSPCTWSNFRCFFSNALTCALSFSKLSCTSSTC